MASGVKYTAADQHGLPYDDQETSKYDLADGLSDHTVQQDPLLAGMVALCLAAACNASHVLLCTHLAGLQDGDAAGGVVSAPQLVRLDWSGVAGLIALQPGTQLTVSNLDMGNFSLKSDYTYSPDTPYQSVGSWVSIWPTINGAPNTTVRGKGC